MRNSRSKRLGDDWYCESIPPGMNKKESQQVGHFFLKHHGFRNVISFLAGADVSSDKRR